MRLTICALSVCGLMIGATTARDAAALKTDLNSMLPSGKTGIKCAWIRGGGFTEFALDATNTAVYVVSNEDGAIRRLYPTSSTGSFCNVNISANGERVFFLNRNSGRLCKINWDGTGFAEVSVGGEIYEYWCNPSDGSDWAIVNANGMSRVKIDAPATKVQVCNMDVGGDGCGLSDDGTKFYGYDYNHNPAAFGVVTVSSLNWSYGPHGGCQGSMSGGSSPKYSHNPSGHTKLCIHSASTQTQFTEYATASTVQSGLSSKGLTMTCGGATTEGARFVQHADYVSFCMGNSKANPILMRIPDLKFIYMEDNLSCTFCGDMDACFLGGTEVASNRAAPRLLAATAASETYLPNGRLASQSALRHANAPGIILSRSENGRLVRTAALVR